mmetsp:Transcript_118088/g.329204  ORF Transcript_118088/g.329204 Transcript_118088/m.329204 type:complete len:226 (+) Transcript_118088:784-1461(+)
MSRHLGCTVWFIFNLICSCLPGGYLCSPLEIFGLSAQRFRLGYVGVAHAGRSLHRCMVGCHGEISDLSRLRGWGLHGGLHGRHNGQGLIPPPPQLGHSGSGSFGSGLAWGLCHLAELRPGPRCRLLGTAGVGGGPHGARRQLRADTLRQAHVPPHQPERVTRVGQGARARGQRLCSIGLDSRRGHPPLPGLRESLAVRPLRRRLLEAGGLLRGAFVQGWAWHEVR